MASKNKNLQKNASSPAVTVTEKIPLVSVIIPMYNAAKLIPLTFETLLYQTMKDFEVVVIDDYSTDNSVEVVENFKPAFLKQGIKLHVIKLPKNTGMPYLPRNVGINFARGKYIAFLDNDDFFTKTALEELSTIAEDYQADVVNMPEVFYVEDNGNMGLEELLDPANHKIRNCQGAKPVRIEQVTAVSDNPDERIKLWLTNQFHWATWTTFCKRDFWVANQINFPFMPVSDDMLANFACLCLGKKVLLVPNILYIQRERTNSISHEKGDVEKFFHRWVSNLTLGFKAFEQIMNNIPFLAKRPDYQYAILDWFFKRGMTDARHFPKAYSQFSPALLNQFVRKEFHSDDAAFASYLFDLVNIYRIQAGQLQSENHKLRSILQAIRAKSLNQSH